MCPGTGGVEDFEHFGGFVEQRVLAGKGSVHPPCDVEPLLARFGREVAERADGFLARAFGGGDRLHQQIAGVGFVFVLAGALTKIHCATMVARNLRAYNIIDLNRLNRLLLVVRSRTNKSIEVSRGVGTATSYGKSNRSAGVDQAKTVAAATAYKASLTRIAGSRGSQTMIGGLAWAQRIVMRLAAAQEPPRCATRRCRFNDHRLGCIVMVVESGRHVSRWGPGMRG